MPRGASVEVGLMSPRVSPGTRAVAAARRGKIFTMPMIGVLLYLFVIHSYKLPIAGAAVIFALVTLAVEAKSVKVPAFLVWFAAWLLWGLVGIPGSGFPALAWEQWLEFSKIWLIAFVAVNAIRTPAQLFVFALAWLGMFALFPVRGTLFNMLFGISTQGRYAWNYAYSNPNDLAAYTLLLLALSVAMLRVAPARWVRFCALAGVFVLPVIIFFTQSRGGLLGLGFFTLLVFAGERARLRLLAIGLAAAGIIALTAPEGVWDRIRGMKNLSSTETLREADSSAEQRYTIWKVAGKIIKEHPVGGVGLGAYPEEHFSMVRRFTYTLGFAWGKRDTHSTYLNVAAETGVVGVALFIAILLSAMAAGRKAHRRLRRAAGSVRDLQALVALRAGLLGFMVCAIFGTLHREPQLYLLLAIIVHYSSFLLQAYPETRQAPAVSASPRLGRRPA